MSDGLTGDVDPVGVQTTHLRERSGMTPEPTVQDKAANNSEGSRPMVSRVGTPTNRSANTTKVSPSHDA